jgi:hemerythrin-like metal-binding protein
MWSREADMLRLEFPDDLLTGHAEVDRQHRMLFDAADRVLAVKQATRDTVVPALRFLLSYVHYHFGAEEALMDAIAYDRAEHHKRQHKMLREAAEAVKEAALAGEDLARVAARLHVLFLDGYVFHIRHVDAPLAAAARDRGLEGADALPPSGVLVQAGRLGPEHEGVDAPVTTGTPDVGIDLPAVTTGTPDVGIDPPAVSRVPDDGVELPVVADASKDSWIKH